MASSIADGVFIGPTPSFLLDRTLGWAMSVRRLPVALYLNAVFDIDELEWLRPRLAQSLLDSPEITRRNFGLEDTELADAIDALAHDDDEPARKLVTDEIMAHFVLSGQRRRDRPPGRPGRSYPSAGQHRPLLANVRPGRNHRALHRRVGHRQKRAGMTVGVIAHIENPSFDEVRQLARTAEQAGADWLGVADAFWWRDTWLLLAEAARATARIRLGPLVTNPYLRHPFVTVSALASLQDLAGPRVFAGLGAGGSETPPGGEDLSGGRTRSDRAPRVPDPQRRFRWTARPFQWASPRSTFAAGTHHRGSPLQRRAALCGARG